MTKEEILQLIKLLAALESWSFVCKERLPDYLYEKNAIAMERLEKDLFK